MKIFDLEQAILGCWHVTDDIELLYERIGDSTDFQGMNPKHVDDIMNILLGLREVYDMRFNKCWSIFEETTKEYHKLHKMSGIDREEEILALFSRRPTSMADEHEE